MAIQPKLYVACCGLVVLITVGYLRGVRRRPISSPHSTTEASIPLPAPGPMQQTVSATFPQPGAAPHASAGIDPHAALLRALEVSRGEIEADEHVGELLQRWAQHEPREAWQWALVRPGAPKLDAVLLIQRVAGALARHAPDVLISVATETLAQSHAKGDSLLEHVLAATIDALRAAGHPESARDTLERWVHGANAAHLGVDVFIAAASAIAGNPADRAIWLASLPDSDARNYAFTEIVAQWSHTAPESALAHARVLPEEFRLRASALAFGPWLERDPIGATVWLASHEADPFADRVILEVLAASSLGKTIPRVTLQWAEVVRDSAVRAQAIERVVTRWSKIDPAAARVYIAESPHLDVEQKNRLLRLSSHTPLR